MGGEVGHILMNTELQQCFASITIQMNYYFTWAGPGSQDWAQAWARPGCELGLHTNMCRSRRCSDYIPIPTNINEFV